MEEPNISCEEVQDLVFAFVDGEAAERAPAIRRHLIDCASCRAVVQEANALRGWFEPTDEVPVPAGFADRVAGLAFGGAEARTGDVLVPFAPAGDDAARAERGRLVDFAVMLTAVAAAALIVVTLLLATDGRGGVDADASMQADMSLEDRLEELERRHAEESAAGSSAADGADGR